MKDPEEPPLTAAQFYDEIAPFADPVYGGDEHEVRFFQELLGPPQGRRRLLELGVGTGRMALALARAGWMVVGVDQSLKMLEQARAKAAREGLSDHLFLALARAEEFSAASRFESILAVGLFFHLRNQDEYRRVLANAHRLLEPGGRFLFDVECRPAGGWGDDGALRPRGAVERDGQRWVLLQSSRAVPERREQHGLFVIEKTDRAGATTERKAIRHIATFVDLEQIAGWARETGYTVESCWGDYEGNRHSAQSPELILSLRKHSR